MLGAEDLVTRSLVALAGLGLGVLGLLGLVRLLRTSNIRKTLCIGLLLVSLLVETALVEAPALDVGLQIYANDVIAALMLAVLLGAFMFRQLAVRGLGTVLWLAFGLVMVISFVDGIQLHGKTAGVDVRPNVYFWIAALYCCVIVFDHQDIRLMGRWCLWTAYGLIGIAAYRWVGYLVGFIPLAAIVEVGAGNEFRALPSGPAFCVAAVGLVQFMAWLRGAGGRFGGVHALVFAIVMVVLQHRSVWAASAVGYVAILLQQRGHMTRRLPWLIGLCLVAGAGIGIAMQMGVLDRLVASLWESTISIADPRSTTTDRLFGWEALMGEWIESPLGTVFFGYPYGTSYRRVVDRVVVEYSPHNFYVQLLLRTGVVGTALFVFATLAGMCHALFAQAQSEFDHLLLRGLGVVLLASMVYYVPYQGFYVHGAVTGLALGQLVRHRLLALARTQERSRTLTAALSRRSRWHASSVAPPQRR
jgi:O-antigen ligase